MSEASFQMTSFVIMIVVMLIPALMLIFAVTIFAKAVKRFIRVFTR